jgi:hypothetical protein
MAETIGLNLRAGFQREAVVNSPTWPAAAAAALTLLLPALDLQANDGITKAGYSSVQSGLGPAGFDVLSKLPTAGATVKAKYQGMEQLWACVLGHMAKRIGATLLPELLAAGVYRHLYEIDTHLSTASGWAFGDGFQFGTEVNFGQRKVRRGTFAVDMQVSVWEWLSSMIQAVTFQAEAGRVTLTVELVAHSLSRASSVNTTTTIPKVLPNVFPGVLFSDLVWRVAPYSAGTPLASGDAVTCTSLTLRLENNLVGVPGPRTALAPEEYERDGDARVTVTFATTRHTADTWQTRWDANTVLMADAKFTSEKEVATGQPYKLNLYFPSCVTTNGQLGLVGPQLPSDTVQLVGVIPAGAAAGFPTMSHTGPLAVEVVSGLATNPLL